MGSMLDTVVIEGVSHMDILLKFRRETELARLHESNDQKLLRQYLRCGYTGTIAEIYGIGEFFDSPDRTRDEASAFIEAHHKKWEQAIAVAFTDKDGKRKYLIGGWCSS